MKAPHVCLGALQCEECRAEHRCEFTRCDDDGKVLSACTRLDTESFVMADGGSVDLCTKHASWAPALGVSA